MDSARSCGMPRNVTGCSPRPMVAVDHHVPRSMVISRTAAKGNVTGSGVPKSIRTVSGNRSSRQPPVKSFPHHDGPHVGMPDPRLLQHSPVPVGANLSDSWMRPTTGSKLLTDGLTATELRRAGAAAAPQLNQPPDDGDQGTDALRA